MEITAIKQNFNQNTRSASNRRPLEFLLNCEGFVPTGHFIDHRNVLRCTLLKACVYFYIFKMRSKTLMG